MLTGKVDSEAVTLVLLDHPQNIGFPTFWHARGYGLFAPTRWARKHSATQGETEFTLEPKQSVTFRYRC